MNNVAAFVQTYAGQVVAVGGLALAAALVLDWALAVADAIVVGTFSTDRLPDILRNQLATKEAMAIAGMLGAAAVAAVVGADLSDLRGALRLVADALLVATGAAAALYSAPTWRDVKDKVRQLAVDLAARARRKPITPRIA